MKIIACEQGSPEWFKARAGIITCSELDALITPAGKPREGQGVETYINRKIAERINGGPLVSFSGGAAEQGSILEAAAIPSFELLKGLTVKRVGLITTDDGEVGCSPDGLFGQFDEPGFPDLAGGGVEIKCPMLHTHIGYLRDGDVPKEYLAQVQGGMYVTGLSFWYFMSFHTQARKLIVPVSRDERWIEAIDAAVTAANLKIKTEHERIMQ